MIDAAYYKLVHEAALKAAEGAGAVLLEGFRSRSGVAILKRKAGLDYSIEMDARSESFILESLRSSGVSCNIVTEEGGELRIGTGGQATLYIDPLDGTFNYSNGVPFFCVSIGVYADGSPLSGVVYDPVHMELFTATRGGGSYLNSSALRTHGQASSQRAQLLGMESPGRALHLVGSAGTNGFVIRVLGSVALDLCYVACGRHASAVISRCSAWDRAAGMLIASEAGAVVTDFSGASACIGSEALVASRDMESHSRVLAALGAGLPAKPPFNKN